MLDNVNIGYSLAFKKALVYTFTENYFTAIKIYYFKSAFELVPSLHLLLSHRVLLIY